MTAGKPARAALGRASSANGAILEPGSRVWAAVLERVSHDVFHEPAYARVEAARLAGRAIAGHARRGAAELLLPLVVRPIPGSDRHDAVAPYGYPGPLFVGAADPAVRRRLLDDVLAALAGEGLVTVFARLHPILNDGLDTTRGALVRHGETVVIDVRQSPDALWGETRSGHRSEINRALRAGHRVSFDADFRHLDRFRELYAATMERVGAHPEYRFDDDYVRSLRDALGPGLRLCVVEIEESVAAAALFTVSREIVGYHLSAADPGFARWAPAKLILHHVRQWAHETGAAWLHLGGGVGAQRDSLFAFKAGFGPLRRPFWTWRVVLDEVAYRDLGGEPAKLEGWFPAYRAVIAPAAGEEPSSPA